MPANEKQKIDRFTELGHFSIDERSVQLLTWKFCAGHHVVVLNTVDVNSRDPVTVGMLDPEEVQLIGRIEDVLKRPVHPVRLNEYEIKKAIEAGFGKKETRGEKPELSLAPIDKVSFEPGLSTSRRINEILGRAITLNASDVHIECYEEDVDVRFRIDGILHQINTSVHRGNISRVISRLKILSDLDISEKRAAQDGRIRAGFGAENKSRQIDFRISIIPGPFGEDAVLRILDSEKPSIGLEKLGFSKKALARFRAIIRNPEGMILVTGPTGSGKTTTLYAALQEVNTDQNKVLTVEDPIEYIFPKVNQKQVGPRMTFAGFVRAFLRHDPDIMMVGEIRDEETAEVALRAAQTGHLLLSTLHTNDSVGAVSRLKVLGLNPALMADALLCVLSQRLVRTVCENCKVETPPDRFAGEIFKRTGAPFPLFRGEGCDKCRQTGFRGRIGIYELFISSREIADMISTNAHGHEIRQFAKQHGMRSLFDDALSKVKAGITTFSELRRTVPYQIINEPPARSPRGKAGR
ncbi:MAG: type II/IV secretion system protein [Desulfobacterales bacterium]|nr:type II/IV secretion system protein [Desulfobacterales bacterium]